MDELDELRLKIALASGWEWREWDDGRGGKNKALRRDGNFIYGAWFGDNDEISISLELPDWPNDIAAAWELVEEMTGNDDPSGCTFRIIRRYDENMTVWGYSVITGEKYKAGTTDKEFWAATAPEAISRAYLAWKESQGA